jgi:hypothetical protein
VTPDRQTIAAAKRDPVAFVETILVDPETGQPFTLLPEEVVFLREAFALTPDGRLAHPELVYSAIKKSSKTAFAAMIVLYVVVALVGRNAEAYCVANDLEQAQGRVFAAICRIIEASPLLKHSAKITGSKVEFVSTGATITAIAADYAGAAGSNAHIVVFDELWAYVSEWSMRLWDEIPPPPTRKIACRLVVTYAGFEGESTLLEGLYNRGIAGEEIAPRLFRSPGLLMAWHQGPIAPWQTPEWLEQMRVTLRPLPSPARSRTASPAARRPSFRSMPGTPA